MSVFFQVRYERDGEVIWTCSLHADNEADAVAKADASFSANPEYDFPREGIAIRVGRLAIIEGKWKVICAEGMFDA